MFKINSSIRRCNTNLSQAKSYSKLIKVNNPVVEMDGDEMTRVMWKMIKDNLILPYVDLKVDYYDLGLVNRELTKDRVTIEAAMAIKKHMVGIKCATITPDRARVEEYKLSEMYPSPNGTIRNFLNGTIFRAPIMVKNVPQIISNWKKPIHIGRHGSADQYKCVNIKCEDAGKLELVYTTSSGKQYRHQICEFNKNGGVGLGMYNTLDSIVGFAHSSFKFALQVKMPLYLSTKNTILKNYDALFKDTFKKIYNSDYKNQFVENGLFYEHKLIDDLVAQALKGEGGFVWACKNYDGDVQSDMIAQGFGSLGLMTSILLSPDMVMESEAAHGTVTRHYRLFKEGKETSTNSVASIFAWTKGLSYRGKLDNNKDLVEFCNKLENTCITTIENGHMTKDLAITIHKDSLQNHHWLNTENFIKKIKSNLEKIL